MTTMVSWQMVEPNRPLERVEVPIPEPGVGEVVLKVSGCGVCHTDLHYREGAINDDFPFLLGHEAAGVVESVGSGVDVGDLTLFDGALNELRGIDAAIMTRSVDIMISRLRQKLGDSVKPPRFIQTVWGRGYSFIGVPLTDD